MKAKGSWELICIAAAMGAVLVLMFVAISRVGRDPHPQMELKSKRIELLNKMRLSLSKASEEQNYAVMSTSELASREFLDRALAELTSFDRNRIELVSLAQKPDDEIHSSLTKHIDETFREFQSISNQVSELSLQCSNRKAFALTLGPAMNLLQEVDQAFSKFENAQGELLSQSNLVIPKAIGDSRVSGLRIQVLLMVHIAEPTDREMDKLEKAIAEEETTLQQSLVSLRESLNDTDGLATIESLYAEFREVKSRIIRLSRENTDLRSVSIALNEKRKAMIACQDALANLENAIRAAPILTTIPKGRSQ